MIPNRIVLDTNVCLDLFVFVDPRWQRLLESMKNGLVDAITSEQCRNEWLAVLHYKQLPITDETRPDMILAFDALIRCIEPVISSTIRLPVCSDGDDQKFMELARDAQAGFLITKDRALLRCARKTAGSGMFQIVTPDTFLKLHPSNINK